MLSLGFTFFSIKMLTKNKLGLPSFGPSREKGPDEKTRQKSLGLNILFILWPNIYILFIPDLYYYDTEITSFIIAKIGPRKFCIAIFWGLQQNPTIKRPHKRYRMMLLPPWFLFNWMNHFQRKKNDPIKKIPHPHTPISLIDTIKTLQVFTTR